MDKRNEEMAVLGGGCFWCLEAVYDDLSGVLSVESGYAGGQMPNPTYEQVCSGRTGHAEVVRVTYDPNQISYAEILEVFFTIHDPTTLNRQGADVGTQYRSVIFTQNGQQVQIAHQVMQDLESVGIWDRPLVTQVEPVVEFFIAEDYHKEYFRKNPYSGYCRAVVAPKVAKFRQKYAHRLKSYEASK